MKNPTIITITSNKQCRDAMEFFEENKVKVNEQNVLKEPLTIQELIYLGERAGNILNLIATRSKAYSGLKVLLDNDEKTKMSQVYEYILENPKVLKYPIIFDHKRLNIGYSEDEIRAFLPREMKNHYFSATLEQLEREQSIMKTA